MLLKCLRQEKREKIRRAADGRWGVGGCSLAWLNVYFISFRFFIWGTLLQTTWAALEREIVKIKWCCPQSPVNWIFSHGLWCIKAFSFIYIQLVRFEKRKNRITNSLTLRTERVLRHCLPQFPNWLRHQNPPKNLENYYYLILFKMYWSHIPWSWGCRMGDKSSPKKTLKKSNRCLEPPDFLHLSWFTVRNPNLRAEHAHWYWQSLWVPPRIPDTWCTVLPTTP